MMLRLQRRFSPSSTRTPGRRSTESSALARALHRRHGADRAGGARRGGWWCSRGAGHPLDIDHGTYPLVTSSNTVAGRCAGAGVGPARSDEVWGIAKAYTTRVGAGPFPHRARRRARGAHPRRRRAARHHHDAHGGPAGSTCGARYATRVNGLTGLVVTKLDVLTGIDPLQVAVRYLALEGASFEEFPYHQTILHRADGDYVELPGWHEDISTCRSVDELPRNAQAYLDHVADFLGIPVVMIGVGPGRDEMIWTGAAERLRPRAAPHACQAPADQAWITCVWTIMS